MAEVRERRAVPRTTVGDYLPVRLRDGRAVCYVDLSGDGAQIEHLDFLRTVAPCHLDARRPAEPSCSPRAWSGVP